VFEGDAEDVGETRGDGDGGGTGGAGAGAHLADGFHLVQVVAEGARWGKGDLLDFVDELADGGSFCFVGFGCLDLVEAEFEEVAVVLRLGESGEGGE
jgi:hypothetical protein